MSDRNQWWSNRRIVVQDAEWRRLSIPEDDFDVPEANPLNHAHDSHEWDADRGLTVLKSHPAKPLDDWRSLRQDGFTPVMMLHGQEHNGDCPEDCDAAPGHEMPLPKGYRG